MRCCDRLHKLSKRKLQIVTNLLEESSHTKSRKYKASAPASNATET